MKQLAGRKILVGLSGGIACYKACELVSRLVQLGAQVRVVMTRNACEFVRPLTLQALSGHPVAVDTFSPVDPGGIDHVRLADFAEILVVIPATANILAKMAHGIADDLLSTVFVACDCPTLAVVAMNTRMYENPATRDNMALLETRGIHLLHPDTGYLACGTEGVGRLPGPVKIIEKIHQVLEGNSLLAGRRVLVTAGPTRESIDPVRFITNASTGRMGFAAARAAVRMGAARVDLVSGPGMLETPLGVNRTDVVTARQMLEAVQPLAVESDLVVMTAAVGDFALSVPNLSKIKKTDRKSPLTLRFRKNPDILDWASRNRKKGAVVVGFALETEEEEKFAAEKLERKNLDLIVVNNPLKKGAGFGWETNRVVILDPSNERIELPLLDKDEVAGRVLELAAKKFAVGR